MDSINVYSHQWHYDGDDLLGTVVSHVSNEAFHLANTAHIAQWILWGLVCVTVSRNGHQFIGEITSGSHVALVESFVEVVRGQRLVNMWNLVVLVEGRGPKLVTATSSPNNSEIKMRNPRIWVPFRQERSMAAEVSIDRNVKQLRTL